MFGAPGTVPEFGHKLTREAAEQVARNWWVLLLNDDVDQARAAPSHDGAERAARPDQTRLASAGS